MKTSKYTDVADLSTEIGKAGIENITGLCLKEAQQWCHTITATFFKRVFDRLKKISSKDVKNNLCFH